MDAVQIKHYAKLARIGVTDAEAESLAKDVSRILNFVDALQAITPDMSKIHNVQYAHRDINHVREDVIVATDSTAVKNGFSKSQNGMLKVPKIL